MNSDFLSSRMQMKQSRQRQSNEQLTISKLKKNITNSYSFSKSPSVPSSCGTLNATQIQLFINKRTQCLHILWLNFLHLFVLYLYSPKRVRIFSNYTYLPLLVPVFHSNYFLLLLQGSINYQHSTATNAQILPGSNLAGSDGVTNSSSQDNIQMKAVNFNPV